LTVPRRSQFVRALVAICHSTMRLMVVRQEQIATPASIRAIAVIGDLSSRLMRGTRPITGELPPQEFGFYLSAKCGQESAPETPETRRHRWRCGASRRMRGRDSEARSMPRPGPTAALRWSPRRSVLHVAKLRSLQWCDRQRTRHLLLPLASTVAGRMDLFSFRHMPHCACETAKAIL